MNIIYHEYIKDLYILIQNYSKDISKDIYSNESWNYLEFVTWNAIYKAREIYHSLYLNINRNKSYKYYNHYNSLTKVTWENNLLYIEDWFNKSSFITDSSKILWNEYIKYNLKSIRDIMIEERDWDIYKLR